MFSLHKTRGGVHPPQCKDMRDFACTSITPPERVLIPLNMHIGAPASPVVSEGDHVYVGTLIGQVNGLGSPIHASISGTVTKVATEQLPTGATAPVVEIVSDGKVMEIPTKYPAGGEKVLIKATTGRDVPAGGLPIDAGCLVVNVTTISRVEQYFRYGMPLTCKTVTVTGDCIANPGNYRIPLGMSVRDVIEATGGMVKEPKKIIMGGPMMGRTITNIDCPILKANNAIVALHDAAVLPDETACIRCGRCVRACPLALEPFALDSASRSHDVVALDELAVMNCMECGSCAYVCPAHRRITASIREGKAVYRGEVARLTAPSEKKEA